MLTDIHPRTGGVFPHRPDTTGRPAAATRAGAPFPGELPGKSPADIPAERSEVAGER
ncbi:hypothetical protein [Streptomyces reniochalinae]|uniref:hypothetical protein n=1 Tax=Streptomyces reniochalinae TaxID=2250578 RepID=UPI0015F07042|nr:hypothetical protein [Streptomyces reniochalinae]